MNQKQKKVASVPNEEQSKPHSAKAGKRKKPAKNEPVHDVGDLSSSLKDKVREMLVTGATFEDVAAWLYESENVKLTIRALENHFRAHMDIQAERIKRQMELVETLKKAAGDPENPHAKLAEAALITGLMGLRERTAKLVLQNAIKVRSQEEGNRLKTESHRLRTKKFQRDERLAQVRLKHELAKLRVLRDKFSKVKHELEQKEKGHGVNPETLKRIQEIYGLLSEPATQAQKNVPVSEA
jgi:hypothetical protein